MSAGRSNHLKASAIAPACQGLINVHGFRVDSVNPRVGLLRCALTTLSTVTTLQFSQSSETRLLLNEKPLRQSDHRKTLASIRLLQRALDLPSGVRMHSVNSFPTRCGLGSSTSGLAALTLAAVAASGRPLSRAAVLRLAAAISLTAPGAILGGISARWPGSDTGSDADSRHCRVSCDIPFAVIAVAVPANRDSFDLHAEARTSPLFESVVRTIEPAARRLVRAIRFGAWDQVIQQVEDNVALNYALLSTGTSRLAVLAPESIAVMNIATEFRSATGLPVFCALNSGPSVFCYVPTAHRLALRARLSTLGLATFICSPTGGAVTTSRHLF